MLHILRRENKPVALQFTNEQMSRRQSRDLCKVGFAQLTRTADDISVLAGINVSFRPNLKLSGIRSLNPWWMRRRPLCSGWLGRTRDGYDGFGAKRRGWLRDLSRSRCGFR